MVRNPDTLAFGTFLSKIICVISNVRKNKIMVLNKLKTEELGKWKKNGLPKKTKI